MDEERRAVASRRSGWPGRSAARAVAGAALLDLALSPLFAWNVFTAEFHRRLGVDGTTLTVVFSVGLVAFTVGVLVGGRAADAVSPRRLAWLTAGGAATGLLAAGVAPSLSVLVVTFGVVLGASTGVGYATAVRVAGTVTARRGQALALVVSAYAAGTIVVAPLAAALLRATSLAVTFAVLAAGTGAVLLAGAALLPDVAPVRRSPAGRPRLPARQVAALWIIFGLGSAPGLTAFAHAGDISGRAGRAALAVTILSAGNLLGRLVAGPASDRAGRRLALQVTAGLLVAACAVLAGGAGGAVALAGLLGLGAAYGSFSALVPAATADAVPGERFGTAYGAVFTAWGAVGFGASLAAAHVASAAGWADVFLVFAGLGVVTWIVIAVAVLN